MIRTMPIGAASEQLLPNVIKELLATEGCYLAGGSVRGLLDGPYQPPKDYDFYFENAEAFHRTFEKAERLGLCEVAENSFNRTGILDSHTVQLIHYRFGSIKETFRVFDLRMSCVALDGENFVYDSEGLRDISRRQLVVNNINYGIMTFQRILRFLSEGWTMDTKEKVRFLEAVAANPDCIHTGGPSM